METSSSEPADPGQIESLPKSVNWWGVVVFVALGLGLCGMGWFIPNAQRSQGGLIVCALLFCGIPALMCCWWIKRAYIVADARGVRWRGLGREKSALWSQVMEFYQVSNGGNTFEFVRTQNGQFRLNGDMTNYHALRTAIVERAISATTRQWAPRGATLALGESKTFVPNESHARFFPWMIALSVVCGVALSISTLFNSNNGAFAAISLSFFWLSIAPGLVIGLLCLAMTMAHLPIVQAICARRGESITLTAEDICWQRGNEVVRARWDEVQAFRSLELPGWIQLSGKREIETWRGSFTFEIQSFKQGNVLQSLILQHLPDKKVVQLTASREERAQRLQDGSQWFSYRNPTARALLGLLLFITFFLPMRAGLRFTSWAPLPNNSPSDVWSDLALGVVAFIFAAYALICYFFSGFRINEAALEHRTAWRTRRVEWPELHAVRKDSSGYRLVFETTRGRFSAAMLLDDIDSFLTDIARYAPHVEFEGLIIP